MKLIVAGSRSIKDKEIVHKYITEYEDLVERVDHIICGGAKGVDLSAVLYAMRYSLPYTVFLPNYKMYGKIAPLIRNEKMSTYGDVLLAIWDGKSRGTIHMKECMERLDKPVILITVDGVTRKYKNKEPQETLEKDLANKGVEKCSQGVH